MPLKVGDTFFMNGTGGIINPSKAHLMVCLVPLTSNGDALIVPIVSMQYYHDKTCVLKIGSHPFIKWDSCPSYDFVKAISASEATKQLASGGLKLDKPFTGKLLLDLLVGLVTSEETPGWALNAANEAGLTTHLRKKGRV